MPTEIEQLLEESSEGPWLCEVRDSHTWSVYERSGRNLLEIDEDGNPAFRNKADGILAAKARNLAPFLSEVEQLRTQLSAAKRGWDAAKRIASHYREEYEALKRDTNTELIESERQANAILTDRVEELERENARLQEESSE